MVYIWALASYYPNAQTHRWKGTRYNGLDILSGSQGRYMQYELNDQRCIGQQGLSHAILALNSDQIFF